MIELNGKPLEFEHYPNGESRIGGERLVLEGTWNKVILRYESDEDLIHLLLLKDFLDSLGVKTKLSISYMPYSRMDRAAQGQTQFSLWSITRFINAMQWNKVTVVDPHSDMTPGLLDNAVEVSVIPALITRKFWTNDMALDTTFAVFPDAGAQKKYERWGTFFGNTAYFVGIKHRNFSNGKIESMAVLRTEDVATIGCTAVIIDDLISYGGTFIAIAEQLRKKYGIAKVYLVTAHCEDAAWKGDLYKHIDHVFTTDSMPEDWVGIKLALKGAARPNFITRYSQKELLEATS